MDRHKHDELDFCNGRRSRWQRIGDRNNALRYVVSIDAGGKHYAGADGSWYDYGLCIRVSFECANVFGSCSGWHNFLHMDVAGGMEWYINNGEHFNNINKHRRDRLRNRKQCLRYIKPGFACCKRHHHGRSSRGDQRRDIGVRGCVADLLGGTGCRRGFIHMDATCRLERHIYFCHHYSHDGIRQWKHHGDGYERMWANVYCIYAGRDGRRRAAGTDGYHRRYDGLRRCCTDLLDHAGRRSFFVHLDDPCRVDRHKHNE